MADRCRVWDSHVDTGARIIVKPGPERTLPAYTVDELGCGMDDRIVVVVTVPLVVSDHSETLLRWLLPTSSVVAQPPTPIPTELESLLQCLLAGVWAPKPTPPPKTGITDMETLLQHLLPSIPVADSWPKLDPVCWDWTTIVCFSCGKSGHGVGRCPELNETFPFMLPGWSVEKVGGTYMMVSPRMAA